MRSPEPVLAMLDTTLTPYRVHFHRRIARELPARLLSLHLHARDFFPWTLRSQGDLELVSFAGSPLHGARALATARRIIGFLQETGVQALVVGGYGDPVRMAVILGARGAGIPCLLFGDSNILTDQRGWKRLAKKILLPRLLGRCDAILACGRLGRDYFLRYGAPPDRIFLTPYEPDYDRLLRPDDSRAHDLTSKHGLGEGRRRLLFSGRLSREKRVDLLLKGFERIAPARPEWDLVVVGDGPQRKSLEAQAAPLAARIGFLGFIDDPDELAAIYHACHVLALPSDYEPWGVVVNEGLAAGLALVCSDVVGAAADLLVEGRNGRLFPAGDLDGLCAALMDVTHPDRLPELRLASRQVLQDWRRAADPVAGLRAALAHVRGPRPGIHGRRG